MLRFIGFLITLSACFSILGSKASKAAAEPSITALEYFANVNILLSRLEPWMVESGYYTQNYRGEAIDEVFTAISIEVPRDVVFRFLDSHNAIVNRKPKYSKLIVGCGSLIDSPVISRIFDPQYALDHRHENMDSVDVNALMSPTIIGALGGKTPLGGAVLPLHQYEEIYLEGFILAPDAETERDFNQLLTSDGKVTIGNNVSGELGVNAILFEAGKGWTEEGHAFYQRRKEDVERQLRKMQGESQLPFELSP